MTPTLEPAHLALISLQEEWLKATQLAISRKLTQRRPAHDHRAQLEHLREEAMAAKRDELAAYAAQLHTVHSQASAISGGGVPDPRAPYFAHMRLRTDSEVRDLLLAEHGLTDPALQVVLLDWKTSPLAEVFFSYAPGETYEIEAAGRTLRGVLEARHVLEFRAGELAGIRGEGFSLERDEGGGWRVVAENFHPALAAVSNDIGAKVRTISRLALDPEQKQVVDSDDQRAILVLGEAGCGKTTVALYRLARLLRESAARRAANPRAVVIVPTQGLKRLSRTLLDELSVEGVLVHTFDEWVVRATRGMFPGLPERLSTDAWPAVIRVKRHPAVRLALDKIKTHAHEGSRHKKKKHRAAVSRHDLQEIFGDRQMLEEIVSGAAGELSREHIPQVLEHTNVQFSRRAEDQYRHVDARLRQAVDGRDLDDGTPTENAGTIDVEDLPVLIELNRLRTGSDTTPSGELPRYSHLVIDEAQELSPLELSSLRGAQRPDARVIVAGDFRQQTDPTAYFRGFDRTMAELGHAQHQSVELRNLYRCPAEVTRLGNAILDPSQSWTEALSGAVLYSRPANACHRAIAINDALTALGKRVPSVMTAIICRSRENARALHSQLQQGICPRLILDGEFDFEPGIHLTDVSQVKGLEFDLVIVPDADPRSYPDAAEARRSLYVAITRASSQLWLMSIGPPSPLLAPFLMRVGR